MTNRSQSTSLIAKGTFYRLGANRRDRCVQSAIDEFATHSYNSASMSRISARASIAKGSLYQYFSSKLSLYSWIVEEHAHMVRESYAEQIHNKTTTDLFEQLEAMVLADLLFFADAPRLAHLAFSAEEPTREAELVPIHQRVASRQQAILSDCLHAAKNRGVLRANVNIKHALSLLKWLRGPSLERIALEHFELSLESALSAEDLSGKMRRLKLRSLAFDLIDAVKNGLNAGFLRTH